MQTTSDRLRNTTLPQQPLLRFLIRIKAGNSWILDVIVWTGYYSQAKGTEERTQKTVILVTLHPSFSFCERVFASVNVCMLSSSLWRANARWCGRQQSRTRCHVLCFTAKVHFTLVAPYTAAMRPAFHSIKAHSTIPFTGCFSGKCRPCRRDECREVGTGGGLTLPSRVTEEVAVVASCRIRSLLSSS